MDSVPSKPIWEDPYFESGRRHPAHGVKIQLGSPTIVFVTVNAKDRVGWMADACVHSSLHRIWRDEAKAWRVGYYVIMPDHLHFFCAPSDLAITLERWMQFWKSRFSRRHLMETWAFQRDAFHHRVRGGDEFRKKWEYVRENPQRRGLVERPEDWPFQGLVHEVRW